MAVPPGSRKTSGLIPAFSNRVASRFSCVDFPQPSEPSNVIKGMDTILRQSTAVVERPIFALFVGRVRRKFGLMTEAVAADFLPVLAAESPRRSFVVSVHDVAPGTRETSGKIITALKDAGVRTASLLVVPNYHRQGSAAEDPDFISWLRDLEARGYEIVIHGYFHQRPRRSNERITEKFVTRIYTRDEGEFFDLDYEEAFARIVKARDEFKAARLSPLGFVAPAWLLSAEG